MNNAAARTRLPHPLPPAGETARAHQVRPQQPASEARRSRPEGWGLGAPGPRLVIDTLRHSNSEGAATETAPEEASGPYVPKGCRACADRAWSLETWKKDAPGERQWFCYTCRSWRHAGDCARFITQRDFTRLRTALKRYHVANVLFLVLTYDPKRAPESLDAQFRELYPRWTALRQMLVRGYGDFPGVGELEYASYVEGHRNGRPHMNVLIVSPSLAGYLRRHPATESDVASKRAPRWFRTLAAHAGFGPLATLAHARSKDAAASYVTKFEGGTVAHPSNAGEVAKLSQLPVWAPKRFRRTRSSKGFLPKLNDQKDPNRTGKLHLSPTPDLQKQRQREAMDQIWTGRPPEAGAATGHSR